MCRSIGTQFDGDYCLISGAQVCPPPISDLTPGTADRPASNTLMLSRSWTARTQPRCFDSEAFPLSLLSRAWRGRIVGEPGRKGWGSSSARFGGGIFYRLTCYSIASPTYLPIGAIPPCITLIARHLRVLSAGIFENASAIKSMNTTARVGSNLFAT